MPHSVRYWSSRLDNSFVLQISSFSMSNRIHSFGWRGMWRHDSVSLNALYSIRFSFLHCKALAQKWAHLTAIQRSFSPIRRLKLPIKQVLMIIFQRCERIRCFAGESPCVQRRWSNTRRTSKTRWQLWCGRFVSILEILLGRRWKTWRNSQCTYKLQAHWRVETLTSVSVELLIWKNADGWLEKGADHCFTKTDRRASGASCTRYWWTSETVHGPEEVEIRLIGRTCWLLCFRPKMVHKV